MGEGQIEGWEMEKVMLGEGEMGCERESEE